MKQKIQVVGIVMVMQGSWRWQTPYIVKGYVTKKLKNNEIVYSLMGNLSGKLTYKKAVKFAKYFYDDKVIFSGGLNNIRPWTINIKNSLNSSTK